MAKVKKSGKSWLVVHQTNGTTISRHKSKVSALKKRNRLHREYNLVKKRRKKKRRKKGGIF